MLAQQPQARASHCCSGGAQPAHCPTLSAQVEERGTLNWFSSPLCKPLAENTPAPSWLSTSLARSPQDSGTRVGLCYLSCTTFLQLRTTVIPDTVAIVAWTIDTSLKRRERKGVTPNVTPQGPRLRAGGT